MFSSLVNHLAVGYQNKRYCTEAKTERLYFLYCAKDLETGTSSQIFKRMLQCVATIKTKSVRKWFHERVKKPKNGVLC